MNAPERMHDPAAAGASGASSLPVADGVAAVVFDWAGTLIDFGSLAPMGAFVALFERHGVAITIDEARVPMGLPKWDHIQALLAEPRIGAAWHAAHGHAPGRGDVDRLHAEFEPMSAEAAAARATLVPGALETLRALRARGLPIGTTTGYTRAIMERVLPRVAEQGFEPDAVVCAGDTAFSRPSPLSMYRCFLELGVWPASRVVKVDDTVPGLWEGRHAGCWTVAVTASGNAVGQSTAQWAALGTDAQAACIERAAQQLAVAKPDYTIASVADLLPVIDAIGARIANGERPAAGA